jgi:hypothetical protein
MYLVRAMQGAIAEALSLGGQKEKRLTYTQPDLPAIVEYLMYFIFIFLGFSSFFLRASDTPW